MNNLDNKNRERNDEYNIFLRHLEEEREDSSNFAKLILILVVLFCGILVGLFIFTEDSAFVKRIFGENSEVSETLIKFSDHNKKNRTEFTPPFVAKRQNILLLGVDSNGEDTDVWRGTRSDTIILLNVDPKTRSVNAISVPRDSKVYLPDNHGIQKINAAHALGGVNMTKKTIENTLGIKIDRYIVIHDEAVKQIVDAMGGVPIYVEKPMKYHDYTGKLHINLNKGLNLLDGKNAVGYLRFRKDGLGDIGRTQRQQWFLRGMMEKLQSPQTITKIPELIKVVNTYVKTDMTLYELSQYAAMAKGFDIDKIEVAILPGGPNKTGSISYWILDPEKTQDVVDRLIYRDKEVVTNAAFKAGILYTPDKESQAMELKEELKSLGYEVNCIGSAQLPHSQFIAHSASVSNNFYNSLKRKIPMLNNSQFVYDPQGYYCPSSDFAIILSEK